MNQEPIQKLSEIYSQIPQVNCKRKCQSFCGPIPTESVERANMYALGHKGPTVIHDSFYGELTCSALKKHDCSIYESRPTICRLFGATKLLQCPYGCEPDRWLSDKEAQKILESVRAIGKGRTEFSRF